MSDLPSPKEIVAAAFKEICDHHKGSSQEIYKALRGNWDIKSALESSLGGKISDIDILLQIPSLNMIQTVQDLTDLNGKLVRFTGFVQDMLDQDFFIGLLLPKMEDFENAVPLKYTQLQNEKVSEFDPETVEFCQNNLMMNRGNIICTEIPNENKWLREKRGLENGRFDELAEL